MLTLPDPSAVARRGYFAARWHGTADVNVVFWRDMLAIGTCINVLASFVALMLSAQDAPVALALAVHFAPMPFNGLLCMAIWRSPDRSWWMPITALGWLGVMTIF